MSCDISTQILEIPALGRPFKLGTLYNALTDEIIAGEPGWWSDNDLKNCTTTTRNESAIYSLIAPADLNNKLLELNANGSLQINILTGVIEPKGSADYLTKRKQSVLQCSVHIRCYCNTAIKQVAINQLEKGEANKDVAEMATHIVTQIQYGSESTFTLTKRYADVKDEPKAAHQLAVCGHHLMDVLRGSPPTTTTTTITNGTQSGVECLFKSDFPLAKNVKNPTSYEEAITFAGQFAQISFDSMVKDGGEAGDEPLGTACIVWLYPVVLMPACHHAPALHQEINRTLASECVRHMQGYEEVDIQLDDMLQDGLVAQLNPFREKLLDFRQHFTCFLIELKTRLRELVVNIRSGLETMASFRKLLARLGNEQFAYHPNRLSSWLEEKHEELRAMRRFHQQITNHQLEYTPRVILFPTAEILRQQTTQFTVRFVYQLAFAWLARPEPFLNLIQYHSLSLDVASEDPPPVDSTANPLWCDGVVNRVEKEIDILAELIRDKADVKGFLFAITAPDGYSEPSPSEREANTHFKMTEFRITITEDDSDSDSSVVVQRKPIHHHGWDALHVLCRHYPSHQLIDIVRLLADDADIEKCWDKCNPLLALVRFYTKDNLIDFIRLFLERDIDVNCKDLEGWNALMSLCQCYKHTYTYRLIDIVRLFLHNGIDVNCKTKIGNNALYLLCRNYHKNDLFDIVQLFLENGIDVNSKNNDGWNALHFVIEYYHEEDMIEFFRMFILRGIDVNCKNNDGCNVLLALCRNYGQDNFIDILNLLLGRGIDIHCKDRFGENALHYVCTFCCQDYATEIVELLITSGIDVNSRTEEGWNALLLLCRNYQKDDLIIEIIELLIDLGIDINCKTLDGWNAIVVLCRYYKRQNLIGVARLLIQYGIDINYKTFDGCNALLHICRYYQKDNLYDIVQLLLENGIDVNCQSHAGLNALHYLCQYGPRKNVIEIIRLLIEKGIDVHCKANDGCNALIALCRECEKDHLADIVRLLLESGIDVNCKDHEGWNALHFVCRKCPRENLYAVVRLLIIYNIDKSVMTIGLASARSFLLNRYTDDDVKDIIQML